jgi:transposase
MEVLYARCCGLDVHKQRVVACCITPGEQGKARKQVRSFGTMTPDLLALADWLASEEVTNVAMESTGSYWKPVWNLLEGSFTLLLVNAHHIKTVPGRKTDVKDCEWIADLLRHGLLKASFVPDRPQRELRELTRYRTSLIRERSAEVNRLQKTLEGANVKLASVASNVVGVSGRAILEELVAGTLTPEGLAELTHGRLREKVPQLQRALAGGLGGHQRFLVAQQLGHIDYLDETIAAVSQEITERLRPFEAVVGRLDAIPGVGRTTAEVLVVELGPNAGAFPSAGHAASWAGMCPGNHESAGKRLSGRTRKGNQAVRTVLVEAAQAAGRKKNSYLQAHYHRLRARRGKKKAVIAVGHTILTIAYHLLRNPESFYTDLGAHYFSENDRDAAVRHHIRAIEKAGYQVDLTPKAA